MCCCAEVFWEWEGCKSAGVGRGRLWGPLHPHQGMGSFFAAKESWKVLGAKEVVHSWRNEPEKRQIDLDASIALI